MSNCPHCGSSNNECSCSEQEYARECSINSPHKSFFDCDCEICRPPKKVRRRTNLEEPTDL